MSVKDPYAARRRKRNRALHPIEDDQDTSNHEKNLEIDNRTGLEDIIPESQRAAVLRARSKRKASPP